MAIYNGLIVGKFAPLHKGHDYLIRTALDYVDSLTIIHYGSNEVGESSRHTHLKLIELYPEALIFDAFGFFSGNVPKNDAPEVEHRYHVAKMIELLHNLGHVGVIPDFVFSSENYGEPFSNFLSGYFSNFLNKPHHVQHAMVDLERKVFPISATMIRSDREKFKDWIM